jgi:hypothetical protein
LRSIADIFGIVIPTSARFAALCSRVIGRSALDKERSARADARRRKPASKRCSIRNFGEYAFLEDSRYASQQKNALAAIVVPLQRVGRSRPRRARRKTRVNALMSRASTSSKPFSKTWMTPELGFTRGPHY